MILKFVVLFIALDRMGTIFPIDREKTHIRSYKKNIILESNWECTKCLFNDCITIVFVYR